MALASAHPLPSPAIPKSLAAPRLNARLLVGLLVLAGAILSLVVLYRGAQPQTVAVLRAARDVQPGEVLQSADLQVAAEALPEDVAATLVAASERDALVGRRLAQPLNGGDLVTRRQVQPATLTQQAGVTRLSPAAEALSRGCHRPLITFRGDVAARFARVRRHRLGAGAARHARRQSPAAVPDL